ncbi:MAG: hypothetical protein ACRBFS_07075 [Aureispira sp.]
MKGYWIGIISMITCYWAPLSYSQTINWGPTYKRTSLFNEQQIVHTSEKRLLVWRHYKDPQSYFQYEASMYYQEAYTGGASPFEWKEGAQRMLYQANHYKNNQWRFYYTIPQQATGKELLCWIGYNPETLILEQSQQLLTTTNYNKTQGGIAYRVDQSLNKQTLLYGLLPPTRKQPAQLLVHVLDEEGEITRSQQVEAPQEAGLFTVEDVQDAFLSIEGTAYLLCKFYHKKSRKEEKKIGISYHYALLQIEADGKTTWRDSLAVLSEKDSAIVVSARLYQAPNQAGIYCVGSYKTPSNGGLFQWNIEEPAKALTLAYPTELWRIQGAKPSKKVTPKTYKIKQWLPQADGSFLAIAEKHYIKVYWDKSEGQQALHQLHDILLMKWDAQGELLWYHNIPKRQRGGGEGFTNMKETWYSFAAFEQAGQIHVFYNDLPENKDAPPNALETGYYNQPKALDCWHYRLDKATGELIKAQPLEGTKDWLIYPQKIRLLSNGQVLVAALQLATSVKEKALFRWGQFSLEATK